MEGKGGRESYVCMYVCMYVCCLMERGKMRGKEEDSRKELDG